MYSASERPTVLRDETAFRDDIENNQSPGHAARSQAKHGVAQPLKKPVEVEGAVRGESFVTTESGKPTVTISSCSPPTDSRTRVGFQKGMLEVPPDDFDSMGKEEIQGTFRGRSEVVIDIHTQRWPPSLDIDL